MKVLWSALLHLLLECRAVSSFAALIVVFGLSFALAASAQTASILSFNYADRSSLLSAGWSYTATTASGGTRDTEQSGSLAVSYDQTAHPGTIRIPVGSGEIWEDSNNSQNMLFYSLPSGWTSIRLDVAAFSPAADNQQVGLLAYKDDDNYVELERNYHSDIGGPSVGFFQETAGNPSRAAALAPLTNGGNLILRIDYDSVNNQYIGSYSVDGGSTWTPQGTLALGFVPTRLAIQVGSNNSSTIPAADLAWVQIFQGGQGTGPAVSLSSTSLTFATQTVGTSSASQQVTLINSGGASLTIGSIAVSGDYSQSNNCPTSVASGAGCTITVKFAPTANGVRTGSVTIVDNAGNTPQRIALTGTGKALSSIAVTPANPSVTAGTSQQFGATGTFSDGSTQDVTTAVTWASSNSAVATISNTSGSNGLAATSSAGSTTIKATQGTVSGSTTLAVSSSVQPPSISGIAPSSGIAGQNLTVAINGSNFQSGAQCGFGTGVAVNSCSFSSSSRLNASVSISSSATLGNRSVMVTNPNGQVATLTNGFSVQSNGDAEIDFTYPDRNTLLSAGWSYTATTASGVARNTEQSGSLAVSYDQTAHPGRIRIPIGSGEIWQTANNSQNMLLYPLPSGWTSIRLNIAAFNPTADNQQVGLIAYKDDDNYLELERNYHSDLGGPTVGFLQETAGSTKRAAALAPLSNSGNLILRIDYNSVNNQYSGSYSVDSGSTWTAQGTLAVGFTPTRLAIQVGSNNSSTIPVADLAWVQVFAPASQGSGPAVTLSSTSVNFATQSVGTTSAPQTVTLTNSGGAPLSISSVAVSGDYSQSNNCPASVSAGTGCTITIQFTPTTSGTRTGSVTITDNAGNSPQSIALTGTGKSLSSISVTPVNPTVAAGTSEQFAATGTFTDGSTEEVTTSVTWTSSNTAVASIANTSGSNGLATTWAAGSTAIKATQGTVSGSTTLVVTSATVSVNPQIVSLTPSQTQQFQASTTGVTWAVDNIAGGNSTVGTISSSGLYTASATPGSRTISATSGSQSGSASAIVQNYAGVFTWHYDNGLTGQNLSESALTPANVTSLHFGPIFSDAIDGYAYAEPLYVANVSVPGSGSHNVVFVATEHDSVYAFDADQQGPPLWHASFINPSAGITTVPSTDTNCTDLVPEVGITSTPVIDRSTNTLYVVVRTKENGQYFTRLHALDLTTGAEKFGGPVNIAASISNSSGGQASFDSLLNNQRTALLLANGNVYIGFSSHCDNGPYHGWLLAYSATTLKQTAAFSTSPDGSEGGLWMSGASPSADANGNIFIISGNGTFDADSGGRDYADSFVKLNSALAPTDFFTPFNEDALSTNDSDVGSSGGILLPDQSGAHPHLMLGAGKEQPTRIYVVDRDNMGHFQSGSDSQIVQTVPSAFGSGLYSTAAYWNGHVYFAANSDVLKSFSISNGLLSTSPTSQDSITLHYPGSTPVVSANGASNGVVWTLENDKADNMAVLRAYDANDVSVNLYSSKTAGAATAPPVKFAVPTVANGKVYIGTQTELVVFGLH